MDFAFKVDYLMQVKQVMGSGIKPSKPDRDLPNEFLDLTIRCKVGTFFKSLLSRKINFFFLFYFIASFMTKVI